MNKKGNWTLSAILGLAGVLFIVVPLSGQLPKWWIPLGILFIVLAFIANR